MTDQQNQPHSTEPANLASYLENLFDWNLIAIVSVWIFLLSTFFLIL
ncbi:MAG TPA: hypothetical protein PLM07_19595 [Candidatus Rifleibacterium sp.]|nr:hypothetical protein [Candidatus Rifleibacterium sp.]HPT48093.1 hypothetical protein [Candidatus Rifleibacterium sp.]